MTPEPLVSTEVDLRGYGFMPLHGHDLFGSEFNAKASDSAWRAALTLWWASWNQVPAASLPNDDAALCRLADLGRDVKSFRKIKEHALHGFVLCTDGRLYHRYLAVLARAAWGDRCAYRASREAGRERLRSWRASKKEKRGDETHPETPDETRFTTHLEIQKETASETPRETRFDMPVKRLREGEGKENLNLKLLTREPVSIAVSAPAEAEPKHPDRFADFWAAWPKTERKTDRKTCLEKWRRANLDAEADAIIAHVQSSKKSRQWREGFEPAPIKYLNRRRWDDPVETEDEARSTANGYEKWD